jgi:hypothetical protein
MNDTKSKSPEPHQHAATNGPPTAGAGGSNKPRDLFSLESLRCGQDFAELAGAKSLLTSVPVKKPSNEQFIRCHPSPDYGL